MQSTLSSSYSRSVLPLSRQSAALSHLDSLLPHDLVVSTDGFVPFSKGDSGVLANCSLYGTAATPSFAAGPVCSSFSDKTCAILHALWLSRQHQQICQFSSHLLLSDPRSVLTTLCSPPSFLLPHTLWQIWQELPFFSSCSIKLQWVPTHSFLPEATRLLSWPDGERHLRSLQSLFVFLLLSFVSTLLFSRTGGVLSHRNSLTRRFPRFPLRNLCSLVMLAVFSLVYATTDIAFC